MARPDFRRLVVFYLAGKGLIMATLVLTVAGFFIGGPAGAQIGLQLGRMVDSEYLFPARRTSEGARLKDLRVQSSAYGDPIPLVYGRSRLSGNVIWSSGLIESRQTETQRSGGKGGGGAKVTQVTYNYSASFAVALSARPIHGIGRVWADGKLLRDASGRLAVPGTMRVHKGDEAALPDSVMEAALGIDRTPAHRGLAYVVFEDLALADYGNRIPNLNFEVIADNGAASLANVIADLALRAGIGETDTEGLTGMTVRGFTVPGTLPLRDALDALAFAYGFAAQDGGGCLRFLPGKRPLSRQIREDDLGAQAPDNTKSAPCTRARSAALDHPAEIAIRYIDADRDYQLSIQRARRDVAQPAPSAILDVAAVMTANEAKTAAAARLSSSLAGAETIKVRVTADYLDLDPGDVVRIEADGRAGIYEIVRSSFEGAALALELAAYDDAVLEDVEGDPGNFTPPSIVLPVPTVAVLLDLPLLPWEGNTGLRIFAAANGLSPAWRGAALFVSDDGGARYTQQAAITAPAAIGHVVQPPGSGPIAFFDRASSLTVAMLHDEIALETRSEADVLNGANLALAGNELLQFAHAQLQEDGSYLLSGLLRGRCGTEAEVSNHVPGERFILLRAADLTAVMPAAGDIGRSVLTKSVSIGETLESVPAEAFTFRGSALVPRSPVHARCVRGLDGAARISWMRRTRYGGEWRDGSDVPLAEEQEAYEVDILKDGKAVRTLKTGIPEAVYPAADQAADFGALQSALNVRIYQLSALAGRGAPAFATL